MNKEVIEILNNIKKQNEWEGIEYFKTPLSNEDADKLLSCINQLETNIEEAIEYIKNNIQEGYSEVYETEMRWDAVSGDDLLEILERGKE